MGELSVRNWKTDSNRGVVCVKDHISVTAGWSILRGCWFSVATWGVNMWKDVHSPQWNLEPQHSNRRGCCNGQPRILMEPQVNLKDCFLYLWPVLRTRKRSAQLQGSRHKRQFFVVLRLLTTSGVYQLWDQGSTREPWGGSKNCLLVSSLLPRMYDEYATVGDCPKRQI